MYQGALVSGFVNISVYFTKLANNFKPNDRFFKRIQILLVIQTENQSATSSFSDPLLMQSAIHCSSSGDDSRKLCEVYSNQFTTGNKPCSCCPKKLSCPKFGGAAAPLAPPARTPMSYDFFCTGLVQLVGNTHKASQNKMMRLFEATLRKGVETKGKFKFPVNQMNCFAVPMKCYYWPMQPMVLDSIRQSQTKGR